MKHRLVAATILAALLGAVWSSVPGCAPPVGHLVSQGVARSGPVDPRKSRWDDPQPARPIELAAAPEGVECLRLPAEASPARKRRVRVEMMNSSQVAAYLKRGGNMAILPVGGIAATGPDIPLGARTLNTYATAVLLAERWDALAFPPIPFSWATGGQAGLPGTINISIDETIAYTRAVIDSLYEGGFTRIVLLGEPEMYLQLYALVNTYYRDHRRLLLASRTDLLPGSDEVKAALGYDPGYDLRTMASLRLIGHAGVLEPFGPGTAAAAGEAEGNSDLYERMGQAGLGVPWPRRPLAEGPAVRGCIRPGDVEKAIDLMRAEARKCDRVPACYERYCRQMADHEAFAPWSLEGWDKGVASCRYDAIPEGDATPHAAVADKDTADVFLPLSQFPEEARPEYLRKYRAEFMTAAEMAERLKSDPVAILPCGAFEMHGPHGVLGTDAFEAHSEAVMVARAMNAVVFPPIAYTFGGATERYPGTVSPSHYQTVRYVKAAARALLDAGFRRVCIMWVHGPGGAMREMAVRDLLQEEGRVVFVSRARLFGGIHEALGYGATEDIRTLAGLKILGHPGVFVVDEPADVGVQKLSFHTIVELTACGCRPPWYMGLPTHHLPVHQYVRSGDEDKLIPLMREAAAARTEAPGLMDEYLRRVVEPGQ